MAAPRVHNRITQICISEVSKKFVHTAQAHGIVGIKKNGHEHKAARQLPQEEKLFSSEEFGPFVLRPEPELKAIFNLKYDCLYNNDQRAPSTSAG